MSETSFPTNGSSQDKSRSANHSSSNEKTAVLRNNLHRQECVRQKQRIDDQRRELVRQLSRDEAEMRHLLHELTLDRTAKPASGAPQQEPDNTAVSDTDAKETSDVMSNCVLDPYPITFPCRLSAASEADQLHKKLCRQRALERDASTVVTSASQPSSNMSATSNPHPKLCRLPSSPALLTTSSFLRASVQDESRVWVGDPLAIGSVRRPLKSSIKLRTGQLASPGDDVSDITSSVTSLSGGVTPRRGQASSRSSNRPRSCCERLSDNGGDKETVGKRLSGDAPPAERKNGDSLASKALPVLKDRPPQATAEGKSGEMAGDGDRPRLGSDPPSRNQRKPLAKMIRQKSLQEIVLNRSILSYAQQNNDNSKSHPGVKGANSVEEGVSPLYTRMTKSVRRATDPNAEIDVDSSSQGKSSSPIPPTKYKFALEVFPSGDADTRPKRQFKESTKGMARTRHGSLKDRLLKDIQESSQEGQSGEGEGAAEKKKGFRRTKSLKARSEQAEKSELALPGANEK